MTQNTPKPPYWAIVAIVLAAACSLVSIAARHRVEARNKATGLCLDIESLRDAASSSGLSIDEMLSKAKASGLTGVTISEETLADQLAAGAIQVVRLPPKSVHDVPQTVLSGETGTVARAMAWLNVRHPGSIGTMSSDKGFSQGSLLRRLDESALKTVSLGVNPEDARAVKKNGLMLIVRHLNPPGASRALIKMLIADSASKGADVYLPEGDQVLGQRELLDETAKELRRNSMGYATPEFAKISGDARLSEKMLQFGLVRLHSIQTAEIERSTPAEVIERFSKAARERNIRLLLVRPLTSASADPSIALCETLRKIKSSLAQDRVPVGMPKAFGEPQLSPLIFPAIGCLVAITGMWVVLALFSNPAMRGIGAIAMLGVAGLSQFGAGRPFTALAAAMIFPIAAYLILESRDKKQLVLDYAIVSAVSLVGGLCVAGLLNGLSYYLHVDQFFAVKLAHFGPIVIVAWLLIGKRLDLRELWKSPVAWGAMVLTLLTFAALGLMLARTGNDNPAAVSGLEVRFRGLLDAILYTRPRTKEFLIGHPALVIGLLLMAVAQARSALESSKKLEVAAAVLLTIGAVGQTSIVNTMCHLHTPVLLSLARIGIGLLVGFAIGLALWIPIKRMIPKETTS